LPFALWELTLAHTPPVGAMAWGLMALTALVPGLGAYWLYGWAQRVLGASRTAAALYLGPLYTALMGWLTLDERLGWFHLVGGVLILGGVALVTRPGQSR
ncbi:MAG: EamA family transporter, partial [Betaproteobacteria bacterium]|nr:EamA family transporter [Candidatus Fonsibacter lacus]